MKKIRIRLSLPIRINAIIQNLFLTNSASHLGLGLVMTFIPLFVVEELKGSIEVAAMIASVSPIIQGIVQAGSGPMLDKLALKNERWPFYFFIARQLADALYLILLVLVSLPWQLYVLQGVRGLAGGITMPSSNMIQGKYIDRGKEGTEWGIGGGTMMIFHGIGLFFAGIITAQFGFKTLFVIASIWLFIAALFAVNTLKKYKTMKAEHTNRVP